MKLKEIYIRDPYILLYQDRYYMYGKTQPNRLEFVVYTSSDLVEWSSPRAVFTKTEDFWGDCDFWAPEVHCYRGAFYLFASFKSRDGHRGTQIFKSDKPDGTFKAISESAITPTECDCLDGTLYVDKAGNPHIVFCEEWSPTKIGTVCSLQLAEDLKTKAGEKKLLWKATDFEGACSAFGTRMQALVTDGPFFYRDVEERLCCIWSTFVEKGYAICLSMSDNGDIDGNWSVLQEPLFDDNGGHGMLFQDKKGKNRIVLHQPNEASKERAVILDFDELLRKRAKRKE